VAALCFIAGGLLQAGPSEYQVKALFLYNFTKYVDWPGSAFAASNSPLVIGVYGNSDILSPLQQAVIGKSINNHIITVKTISGVSDVGGCAIVFVSASANASSIINRAGSSPILTVGEDEEFIDNGGIINFVLREGKVRIDVNLRMARRANLSISSSLLSIADHVRN
jgi:hypothetical protein